RITQSSLYRAVSSRVFLPFFSYELPPPPRSPLFPYTRLFRSSGPCSPTSRRSNGTATSSAATGRPMRRAGSGSAGARCRSTLHRSEEHTSELQSRFDLVCRLLLEKKKIQKKHNTQTDHSYHAD